MYSNRSLVWNYDKLQRSIKSWHWTYVSLVICIIYFSYIDDLLYYVVMLHFGHINNFWFWNVCMSDEKYNFPFYLLSVLEYITRWMFKMLKLSKNHNNICSVCWDTSVVHRRIYLKLSQQQQIKKNFGLFIEYTIQ